MKKEMKKNMSGMGEAIEGRVRIRKKGYTNTDILIKGHEDIFNGYVCVNINEDFISIKRVGIDYRGKSYRFCKRGGWCFTSFAILLKEVFYMVDEDDSTEDELIIYLNDDD